MLCHHCLNIKISRRLQPECSKYVRFVTVETVLIKGGFDLFTMETWKHEGKEILLVSH